MVAAHATLASKSVEDNHAPLDREAVSHLLEHANAALSRHIAARRGAREEREASSGTMIANASLNSGFALSRSAVAPRSLPCSRATVSAC